MKTPKAPVTPWDFQKIYFRTKRNYYGLLKHDMLTDNEKKIMLKELARAKHDWDEAEEKAKKK